MKTTIYTLLVAAMVAAPTVTFASTTKDRTKFDCRETVRIEVTGGRYRQVKFVKVCPHTEQMKAGKCVTNIWGQMRCLE
jgi:hypothetical protein